MAVYTEVPTRSSPLSSAATTSARCCPTRASPRASRTPTFFQHHHRPLILTLYEKRVREADLPFFLGLMRHLADRGLTCPLPVENRAGEALGRLAGRPAAIITFLDGSRSGGRSRTIATRSAPLWRSCIGPAPISDGASERALPVDGWPPLFAGRSRGRPGRDRSRRAHARGTRLPRRVWPSGLPAASSMPTSSPTTCSSSARRVGLIDFYFACTDAFAYDLAICLNAWCFEADGSFNVTKGGAMIAGYQTVRRLAEPRSRRCRPSAAAPPCASC